MFVDNRGYFEASVLEIPRVVKFCLSPFCARYGQCFCVNDSSGVSSVYFKEFRYKAREDSSAIFISAALTARAQFLNERNYSRRKTFLPLRIKNKPRFGRTTSSMKSTQEFPKSLHFVKC